MKRAIFLDTQLGRVGLAEQDRAITNLFFQGTVQPEQYETGSTPLLERAKAQLLEYLAGRRQSFDLPLAPEGTPFQRQVWQALKQIPYGQTRSYGWLAQQVGRPQAARAVGHANGQNPLSILLPCHRVVGANGALTGYAGGLERKKLLLRLEGIAVGDRSIRR